VPTFAPRTQPPAPRAASQARSRHPPLAGRLWSHLAFAPVVQRQPDPKVDYFPHKTRAKKVNDALTASPVNKADLFTALEEMQRDPYKAEKLEEAYKSLTKKELNAELGATLSGDDLARARFLLYAPPTPREGGSLTVDKPGTEEHRGKAAGGEVTFNKDVEYSHVDKSKVPEAFSIGYAGKEKEARFIQFLWSEILVTKPGGPADDPLPGLVPTVSGNVDLTTDRKAPKRIVDSGLGKTPFYDRGGADVRTSTGVTIYDRPSHSVAVVDGQFDKEKATRVVERDHFDDYLIVGYKTVYRVSLVVEWVFSSKQKFTRETRFESAGAVTALPADARAVLVKKYPKFEYIQ
jgi:hypothetical protein